VKDYSPIPNSGIWGQIFYQTRATLQVFGWPKPAYSINLIQLIILLILAVVVVFVTERLTKNKVGGLAVGVLLTVIGAIIIQEVTRGLWDFSFEGVRIISSLVGAIIVGVFYVLIRAQFSGNKSK
jgi:uncharacterized membrane protein YeaQ/YmgE (transglycosylase-associated protein family)